MSPEPAEPHAVADPEVLRSLYRDPPKAIAEKERPSIDASTAAFIAASPFFVLATSSPSGADASPRGGPPGFVAVLDPTHVAFGDLSGNNRLDSFTNIVEDADVGLLFMVPGMCETIRVNGRARITTDPEVLDRVPIDGRRPKVAVVVEVVQCYLHCAKALRRSSLWDPATWPGDEQRPSAGRIIVDAYDLPFAPELVEADLEADYGATMWDVGGDV